MSADTAPSTGRVAAWQRTARRIEQTAGTLSIGEFADRVGYKAGVVRDQMRRDDDPVEGSSRAVLLRPAYDYGGEPRWAEDAPAEFHRRRDDEVAAAREQQQDLPALTREQAQARGLASLRRICDLTGVSLTTLSSRLRQQPGFPAAEAVSHHTEGRRPYLLHSYAKVRTHLITLQTAGRRGLRDLDLAATPETLPSGDPT